MAGPNIPIIEGILHPPLRLLRRLLITGTFSGAGDLTRPAGLVLVNAFGLTWSTFTVPAGYGFFEGQPKVYESRLLQLAAIHRDADDHDLVSEYHDFHVEGIYWLWANAFPVRIHYEISPGVVLVFHWLTL